MSNRKLRNWIRKIRRKTEKMRKYTSKLYAQYMETRLYGDLLKWSEATLYDISKAGSSFRDLVNNYNELVQRLEHLEHNIKE
jgi:hypothetical protein